MDDEWLVHSLRIFIHSMCIFAFVITTTVKYGWNYSSMPNFKGGLANRIGVRACQCIFVCGYALNSVLDLFISVKDAPVRHQALALAEINANLLSVVGDIHLDILNQSTKKLEGFIKKCRPQNGDHYVRGLDTFQGFIFYFYLVRMSDLL